MDPTRRQITKITRNAARFAAGVLRKGGIGPTEYECLHMLRKNEGINQEQLSEILNVDKAAITRMIHNLEKKGYAVREKDERDKRSNRLFTTPKALEIKFDEASAESLFYEWLMCDMAPEEMEVFRTTLEKIYLKSKTEYTEKFRNIRDWAAKRGKPLS